MGVFVRLLMLAFLGLSMSDWSYAADGKADKKKPNAKGERKQMRTYYIGRFAIDVPFEFVLAQQNHEFRLVEIEEIPVLQSSFSRHLAEQKWEERLLEINKFDKPEGVKEIIIKQQSFDSLRKWSRGALYYHDYMTTRRGVWEIWIDYGKHITVFKLKGLLGAQDTMLSWITEVIEAYEPMTASGASDVFCTKLGTVGLPYKRQESTYARFEGPMEMVLEIKMDEIHRKRPKDGIIERTLAAMAVGFANGIDVKKIRSKKRIVAGLPGEEEILQGDYNEQRNVSLDWEYLGEPESGDHPLIQISMDTMADNLTEKIKVWDAILSSFRSSEK